MDNKKLKEKQKTSRRLFINFVSLVMLIFAFVTAFSSILNIMSYNKLMNQIYTNANKLISTSSLNRIEYSLSFGKLIEKFYGMKSILDENLQSSSDFLGVYVVNDKNEILYSAGKEISSVPEYVLSSDYVETDEGLYTSRKINDNSAMVWLLDKTPASEEIDNYKAKIFKIDIILALVALCLTVLLYFIVLKKKKVVKFDNVKVPVILIFVLTQLLFGAFAMQTYMSGYKRSIAKISKEISKVVKNDASKVAVQGIHFEDFFEFDKYLLSLVEDIPEIENIYITANKIGDSTMDKIIYNGKIYYVNVESKIDQEVVNKRMQQIFIDAIILIIIIILFCLELSLFLGKSADKYEEKRITKKKDREINISGVRMFFFVVQMALSLDSGFISIVSIKAFNALGNTDLPESLCGFPVTINIIATIIGIVIWGKLISKIGLKFTMSLGLIFSSIGLVFSSWASNLYTLSFARFICGFGLAAILSSSKVCASLPKDIKERTKFSSALTVGMLAGASCGVVIGGLTADRTSYSFVFLLAGILSLASLLLLPIINIKNSLKVKSALSFNQLKTIFKVPMAVAYILLIVIPMYVASMFLSYSVPLYGDEIGLTQTVISALIMLNYIITAYLTSAISNLLMERINIKTLTVIYVLTVTFLITLFCVFNNLIVTIISIILLSVADSFGLIVLVETFYILLGDKVNRATSMLLFILISKIGCAMAPSVISNNLNKGVAAASFIIPIILAIGIIGFLALSTVVKLKYGKKV